jgi:hypothetical protein
MGGGGSALPDGRSLLATGDTDHTVLGRPVLAKAVSPLTSAARRRRSR